MASYSHRRAEDESMRRLSTMRGEPTDQKLFDLFSGLHLEGATDSPFKNFLNNNFTVLDGTTEGGGILAQSNVSGHRIVIDGNGVSGEVLEGAELGTDAGLRHHLELAVAASALPNSANGVNYYGSTFAEQVIGEHAAKLAGMKVLNGRDRDPAELNPELRARLDRMTEIWNEMKTQDPGLASAATQTVTATAEQARINQALATGSRLSGPV